METTAEDGKGFPHREVPRDTRVKTTRNTRLVLRFTI
jgi:hypothetical protein